MTTYPPLQIPETLAAGPGPGNTDPRVLERFAKTGLADHMQKDVLRGMIEAKEMLRELWGTKNVYTYGVGGTGFSGLDCVLSMILPGDKVVVFTNGTFSAIDGLTIRMKASTNEDLAADSFDPKPKNVITIGTPHGKSVTGDVVDKALAEHKPMWACMAHWETGSGRINDLKGFSDAGLKHGVMGLVDAASSLGVADFSIDDYPGVVAWGSCPQKGVLSLPLGKGDRSREEARLLHLCAPSDLGGAALGHHRRQGHSHPGLSPHAFLLRGGGVPRGVAHYPGLRAAPQSLGLRLSRESVAPGCGALGCDVTSNTTSLIVLNLPGKLAGKEKELVAGCRARGFGIWPTLSEPIQVRIGILNQLTPEAIMEIAGRFADALLATGSEFDKQQVMNGLKSYYAKAA